METNQRLQLLKGCLLSPAFPDCRFLGEHIERRHCELCGSNYGTLGLKVEIRKCSIYGQCSAAPFEHIRKTKSCGSCEERRSVSMSETEKSHNRRLQEGWFDRYVVAPVIDIGCGNDPITEDATKYDRIHGGGDATFCRDIPDQSFMTVYASHVLEHVWHPLTAIQNWVRILKPGGRLIICVPHRDLYEKKQLLPSRWNGDHKTFWLPFSCDPPVTFSLFHTVQDACPELMIEMIRILDDGWVSNGDDQHSGGEYAIELIARKPL